MPTETPTQPEPTRAINARAYGYLSHVTRRSPRRSLGEFDVINGALVALDYSGLDLTKCRDEADVIDLLTAVLRAGRQKLIDEYGGE